jgi:Cu(I)/Ag(I) efflux system membrane fusion protein
MNIYITAATFAALLATAAFAQTASHTGHTDHANHTPTVGHAVAAAPVGHTDHTAPTPAAAPAPAATSERKILFYRSPMHPWVTSPTAGKCTICGMALAPVFDTGGTAAAATLGDATVVRLPARTADVIGVATAPVHVAPLRSTLRVTGVIREDETRHRVLSARVQGRIEKLHVNQIGLEVVRDQPLATLYSPDILTAQRLYLEKRRVGTGVFAQSEIASAREKLLTLGLSEEDIHRLETTGKPDSVLELRAPFDGTVISRNAYEGQYVGVNDALFEISDLSTLWFVIDASERDLASLALGQPVNVILPSLPGEILSAPVAFIDPTLDEATRTARVRVVLQNPKRRILHRQTATGVVTIETPPAPLVPRSAVLYTREHPVAYVVQPGGAYQLRQLKLGKTGDTHAEVLAGLEAGENVVVQAALLIDSQAQLENTALSGNATEHAAEHATGHATHSAPVENATPTSAQTASEQSEQPKQPEQKPASPVLAPAVLESALALTAALSADDLPAYLKHLVTLKAALKAAAGTPAHKTLAPLAEKLLPGPDLTTVRRPFEPFSSALADIVRSAPAASRPAKIFQCRMTPVQGTSRWIQRDNAKVLNPFFGAAMLHCGDELK